MRNILITGGLGLIGTAFSKVLHAAGIIPGTFDVRGNDDAGTSGDIHDLDWLRARLSHVDGVVHLAAVSRVLSGERDPAACWATNVEGTRNVLSAIAELPAARRPWVINASSREVYGNPGHMPIAEDTPLRPINVYGRSKAAAENLASEARASGMTTATVRFANVYGPINDHHDRVIPAFARAAAAGAPIHIDGAHRTFDFTWADDVAGGLLTVCKVVASGVRELPPIHFVSGRGVTLGELAEMARAAGRPETAITCRRSHKFDVERFCGDPSRAKALLGWQATTALETGMRRMVERFAELSREAAMPVGHEPATAA